MRVVMLLGPARGGIGVHVDRMSRLLEARGVDVQIVTDRATARHFDWPDAVAAWPREAEEPLSRAPRSLSKLVSMCRHSDVVHAHGWQAGLVASAAIRAMGRHDRPRLIVSLHNELPSSMRGRLPHVAIARMLKIADLVTGASQDLVDLAVELGAKAAELAPVPSPHLGDLLAAPERDRRVLQQPPLVLTVARIARQKNLQALVEAATRLTVPLRWVVVGDGDSDLLRELRLAAMGTPVEFIGVSDDVPGWLSRADVFVLTSSWEARALVLQEAMAAGVPVVSTAVGGVPQLVQDAGVLVPARQPARIATAVEDVLGDSGAREQMSRRGRELAASWPGETASVDAWLAWYAADDV
ncbi:glycosyltransferase family 4 protein [Luteipulveratus sp. YIM 133132]|uniref:glycosyltransferase family 4 protein n=1 Tax=Luteipulveratus flavus TaxID=3031728 RepID=UPI0023AF8FAA|nr:glycosyltransferase family 4 protein [Luteipulveratus sp. YIM 133132]MDE9366085.1 glycosyltransferase family 4 protein [Luteipulveratus sp. YIM 133132]